MSVFLSYSHDSAAHRETVLRLAERLRQDGVDARLDQYVHGTPELGWPRWMLDQLDVAELVLVICTETYYRRFRGHEIPGAGQGADWEGALITQELYEARSRTVKFVPVLLAAGQERFVPEPLRSHTHYTLTSEESYQDLYRFLTGQPEIAPGPLGDRQALPRRAVSPLQLDRGSRTAAPWRSRQLLWLALAILLLVLLVVALSAFLPRPTRVQLEIATTWLAFTPGGGPRHQILNRSVSFSSLELADCDTAVFAAERLEIADPSQLVPGTQAGETPHFPATAWRPVPPTTPVRFLCRDPDAKLTLQSPDPGAGALGVLDRIYVGKGSEVILEVVPGREPTLRFETTTPQRLSLALGPDLELKTDLVEPAGIAVPFAGDLLTWRARLPESRRTLDVTSRPNGLFLILTPTRDQLPDLFLRPLDLPLASGNSVELIEQNLEGEFTSPLRQVRLRYPDFPAIPAVTIGNEEALGLGGLSQAQLESLAFDADQGVLRARLDGIVERATSLSGAFFSDRRLTLYHTFRYSWHWQLLGLVVTGLVPAIWVVLKAGKKLQE